MPFFDNSSAACFASGIPIVDVSITISTDELEEFRIYLHQLAKDSLLNTVVIDEVHCLSEWGHDFRTSYLNLAKTIRNFCAKVPIQCLTATASLRVLSDIKAEFSIEDEDVQFLAKYTRPELSFEVRNDGEKWKRDHLLEIIKEQQDKELQ